MIPEWTTEKGRPKAAIPISPSASHTVQKARRLADDVIATVDVVNENRRRVTAHAILWHLGDAANGSEAREPGAKRLPLQASTCSVALVYVYLRRKLLLNTRVPDVNSNVGLPAPRQGSPPPPEMALGPRRRAFPSLRKADCARSQRRQSCIHTLPGRCAPFGPRPSQSASTRVTRLYLKASVAPSAQSGFAKDVHFGRPLRVGGRFEIPAARPSTGKFVRAAASAASQPIRRWR